jgi:hypothetical protein
MTVASIDLENEIAWEVRESTVSETSGGPDGPLDEVPLSPDDPIVQKFRRRLRHPELWQFYQHLSGVCEWCGEEARSIVTFHGPPEDQEIRESLPDLENLRGPAIVISCSDCALRYGSHPATTSPITDLIGRRRVS